MEGFTVDFKAMKRVYKLLERFPPSDREHELFSVLNHSLQEGYMDFTIGEYAGYKQFPFRSSMSPSMQDLLAFLREISQDEADYHLRMEEVFDFFVPTKTVTAQDIFANIDTHSFDDVFEMKALDYTEHFADCIVPEEENAFALKMMILKHTTSGSRMVPDKVFQHIYMPLFDAILKPQEIKQILMEIYNYAQKNHVTIRDRLQANKERMKQEGKVSLPPMHASAQGVPVTAKSSRDALQVSIAKRNADSMHKYREQLQKEIDALTAAMEEKLKAYEAELRKNEETELALYDIDKS
jgi:hypothetical protein